MNCFGLVYGDRDKRRERERKEVDYYSQKGMLGPFLPMQVQQLITYIAHGYGYDEMICYFMNNLIFSIESMFTCHVE